MSSANSKSWYLAASVAMSLAVHLLLYGLFRGIPFLPKMIREMPHTPSRTIHLAEVRLSALRPEPTAQLVKSPPPLPRLPRPQAPSNPPPSPTATVADIGAPATTAGYRPDLPDHLAATVAMPPAPAILQIDGDQLPPERAQFNRLIIPQIPRQSGTLPAPSGNLAQPVAPPPPISLAMRLSPPLRRVAPSLPVIPETRLLPPEQVSVLDQLVEVRVTKEQRPDGSGFFRIDLVPKAQARQLRTWHKDVVFVLDVSGSISQPKLNEFTQGVTLALQQMTPADRFEIIAFRHREYALFGELRHPGTESLAAATEFLGKLQQVGSTNIYAALQPIAGGRLKTPGRPLLIFLCSDGQANSGEIVDNRELINAISNQNRDAVSIYSFSAGGYANPFLMDLLSYRNRGESVQTEAVERSRLALARLIGQVSDIVVADLDYQVSSHLATDTFPKQLPHLYRGHPLSIYGRYPAGTKELGLRIVGRDRSGELQELVYRGDLATAALDSGGLAQRWAMQRIYHLYSLLTATKNDNLRLDIRAIAQEYRLQTPYLDAYLAPTQGNYLK